MNIPAIDSPANLAAPPAQNERKPIKTAKGFLNYAGIAVGVFLIFVVVVVMTTEIRLTSFVEIAGLGLSFFVLLFCSYSMYINCSDSGMRKGLVSKPFVDTQAKYDGKKTEIVTQKAQAKLHEFCRMYVEDELRSSRTEILVEVGIDYEEYSSKWLGKDKATVKAANLSKAQTKAIIVANAIKPIKLSPDMLLKRGRGVSRRAPLGKTPERKKRDQFVKKFITSSLTSLLMISIALEVAYEPSWKMFAAVLLKLLSVVLNGFFGYKFGYENIAVDTVDYMNDQIDLIEQFLQYCGLCHAKTESEKPKKNEAILPPPQPSENEKKAPI